MKMRKHKTPEEEQVTESEQAAPSVEVEDIPETRTPENKEMAELREKVQALSDENTQLKDQMMRSFADIQNMRKRFAQEKLALTQYANEELIVELLPVLDSLERAISAVDNGGSVEALLDGVKAIDRQFRDALERRQLTRIETLGQDFDPDLHFALATHETDEVPENTVTHEIEAGYRLSQKVVRPAKVRVAKKP
jgi:molecular chaperone GrpE